MGLSSLITKVATKLGIAGVAVDTAKAAINTTLALIGYYTFYMFILEESCQTAGMGIWQATSAKAYGQARKSLQVYKSIIDRMSQGADLASGIITGLRAMTLSGGVLSIVPDDWGAELADWLETGLVAHWRSFIESSLATYNVYYAIINEGDSTLSTQYFDQHKAIQLRRDNEIKAEDQRYREAKYDLKGQEELELLSLRKQYGTGYTTNEDYIRAKLALRESYDIRELAEKQEHKSVSSAIKFRYNKDIGKLRDTVSATTPPAQAPEPTLPTSGTVTSIYDGDTFYINNTYQCRLIGVDAPEMGTTGSLEAKNYLSGLILNKTVRIEYDAEQRDVYNRVLCYIWVGTTFINVEMLKSGHAVLLIIPPNTKYQSQLQSAVGQAPTTPPPVIPPTVESGFEFEFNVPPDNIYIDGNKVTLTNNKIILPVGMHDIVADKANYQTYTDTQEVQSGVFRYLEIDLIVSMLPSAGGIELLPMKYRANMGSYKPMPMIEASGTPIRLMVEFNQTLGVSIQGSARVKYQVHGTTNTFRLVDRLNEYWDPHSTPGFFIDFNMWAMGTSALDILVEIWNNPNQTGTPIIKHVFDSVARNQ